MTLSASPRRQKKSTLTQPPSIDEVNQRRNSVKKPAQTGHAYISDTQNGSATSNAESENHAERVPVSELAADRSSLGRVKPLSPNVLRSTIPVASHTEVSPRLTEHNELSRTVSNDDYLEPCSPVLSTSAQRIEEEKKRNLSEQVIDQYFRQSSISGDENLSSIPLGSPPPILPSRSSRPPSDSATENAKPISHNPRNTTECDRMVAESARTAAENVRAATENAYGNAAVIFSSEQLELRVNTSPDHEPVERKISGHSTTSSNRDPLRSPHRPPLPIPRVNPANTEPGN